MDNDFLKPAKTVRNNIAQFEALSLSEPLSQNGSSSSLRKAKGSIKIQELDAETSDSTQKPLPGKISVIDSQDDQLSQKPNLPTGNSTKMESFKSPDDVLVCLKEKPDASTLLLCLQYLVDGIKDKNEFKIKSSTPKAAQIINVLVNGIIPDYWTTINTNNGNQAAEIKKLLLACLHSVAGVGALLASLKASKASSDGNSEAWAPKDTLECLAQLMSGKTFLYDFLSDTIKFNTQETQQRMIWQEFVSITVGGKLLSMTSEAIFVTKCMDPNEDHDAWIADGRKYATWLGKNIAHVLLNVPASKKKEWTLVAQLVKRCINMAHADLFVAEIVNGLVILGRVMWTSLQLVFAQMLNSDQEGFFKLILNHACSRYLSPASLAEDTEAAKKKRIGGVAAIIAGILKFNPHLEDCLANWICSGDGNGLTRGIETRRAMIAAMGDKEEKLRHIMERSLKSFGDKLYIKHTSMMQQEVCAQVILLTVGYLYRMDPNNVSGLSRSGPYLQAVSNRLASSLPRARILGMIVGTAISRLVESPDKALNFDVEELDSPDSQWYLDLVNVRDEVGSLEALREEQLSLPDAVVSKKRKIMAPKKQIPHPISGTSKIIAIEELSDGSESDDDLVPYQKPDDDAEDSDDDPTLVNRSKAIAPVYIKDLIAGLQTDDKPEILELALKSGPSLIRRKATFGTELSENIDKLAAALLNLQQGMSKRENQDLRLQGMIACIVTLPSRMAPWFISMYFEGDISQAQRASILTAIGLGARELGGFEDALLDDPKKNPNQKGKGSQASFPSKTLPPNLAAIYGESKPLDSVAAQIAHSTLRPLALSAADAMTGPSVLKVRTFSSRLEVERKQQARKKTVPKNLHTTLTSSFYLPLCSRLQILLSTRTAQSLLSSLLPPPLLHICLQTLILILSTLGPNALTLNTVTRETLLLLTTLHNHPISLDPYILPPLLNLFLITLDLNIEAGGITEERLVTEFGAEISELINWVSTLDERGDIIDDTSGAGESETMTWKIIAAGIMVKWGEVGRKFQGRLLGLGLDDMNY